MTNAGHEGLTRDEHLTPQNVVKKIDAESRDLDDGHQFNPRIDMSIVDELNDNCFVLAADGLGLVLEAFEDEIGRLPNGDELAEVLTWGVRASAPHLGFCTVGIEAREGGTKAKRGDVFAVPSEDGHRGLVFIGRSTSFGCAVGVLDGRLKLGALPPDQRLAARRRAPIFTVEYAIDEGRWIWQGNRPALVKLFSEPAYFYSPLDDFAGHGEFGEFGMAATMDGKTRLLFESEAKELGLLEGSYENSYMWETLEERIHEL